MKLTPPSTLSPSERPEYLGSEEFFALVDNLPMLCWMARADGDIFWYNRRWYDYTGMSPESQKGWGWQSVHDPQILDRVLEQWKASLGTGQPFEMTFPLRGADGHFRPFLTRVVPQRDAIGSIVRWYGTNVDISAQVQAEDSLRLSESRLRTLSDTMPNHVWTASPDGRLDWFNPQVYAYSGAAAGELDGDGWAKIVHQDDLTKAVENWNNALATGVFYETEFRLRRGDGAYRWFIARAAPIRNSAGNIEQWIGTNTDIDEQKHLMQALHDSEKRLLLSQNAAGIASLEMDIASGMVIGSVGFWELWGLSPRESTHISDLEQLVISEDHAIRSNQVTREQGIAVREVEYRIRRADTGELRWLWRCIDFVTDVDGKPMKMFGVMQDITDRKSSEVALRESEQRYKFALRLGRMGSWETNFVTRKRHWSTEAQSLFGLSLPDGIGQVGGDSDEFTSSLHPDDRHLVAKFHELAASVDSFPAEYRIVRPDGIVVWVSGHGQVIERDVDGKCKRLVNVVADITSRKAKEHHIRFLMREMSHRSKNLLAVIQSIAKQTILTSHSTAEFRTKFEDRLQGIAASHDLLVEQNWHGAALSDLVRRHLAPFVEVDSLRVSIQGPKIQVNSNAAQAIGLALHELATNAVKYGALSNAEGSVRICWMYEMGSNSTPDLILRWVESGGPPVMPPTRKGFGNSIIAKITPSSVSGTAALDFAPTGLRWDITLPQSAFALTFE